MTELCTVLGDPFRRHGRHRRTSAGRARAASASTMPWSRSTARKCRSWTARPPLSSTPSTRSASRISSQPRRFIKVLKPVRVEHGRAFAELRPADQGFRLDVEIDFRTAAHRPPEKVARPRSPPTFRRDLARARTFGFLRTSSASGRRASRSAPRSKIPSRSTTTRILNPEGLRFPTNSCATRRSTRSAISRSPARRSSAPIGPTAAATSMNVAVLEALFADRAAYAFVEAPSASRARPVAS